MYAYLREAFEVIDEIAKGPTGVLLVTLFFWRESVDESNSDTESAVSDFVEEQGGSVESVQCAEGSCTAIVDGAAYTVLVHEDEDGDQTFGVSAYAGN